MALDEAAVLDLGRNPISDAAPAGQEVADDEDYLLIEAELSKLDRIDLGEVDWFKVDQSARNILRSKSKDTHIATALGFGLVKKERYAGLAATLGLFIELSRNFWDNGFPARPRRRKARMESLCEHLVDAGWLSGDGKPRPSEFDAVDTCVQRLAELNTLLTEKMPDDAPDFAKLQRRLRDLANERPKPAEPAVAAPAVGEGGAAAVLPEGAVAIAAVADASGAIQAVLSAANFLAKSDLANPLPYALARLVKWARIELPSPEVMTQVEPPDKTLAEALQFQFAGGLWDHLLNNAEDAFRSSDPLWLDLQRYVCAALQARGPQFELARRAILDLTGALVRRLGNGLFDLRFRNGMPLCSGETKMWIESDVTPPQSAGGGGGAAGDGKLMEAWDGARKLAGTGKLAEAVKILQDGLSTCAQRRDRFLWRLRIAQLCYDAQRLALAAPLLEECFEELRRYHIDEWEPALAVEAAQTLYRCRKALLTTDKEPTPEELGRVRDSFAWLCQLDPLAALAADPAGNKG